MTRQEKRDKLFVTRRAQAKARWASLKLWGGKPSTMQPPVKGGVDAQVIKAPQGEQQ